MAVEHNIQQIDEEGIAGNVLSDYQVHTISLVGKGALGRNITKLKSNEEFIETEEGKAIMSKIDKAKALDAEEAIKSEEISEEVIETEKAKTVEEEITLEVDAEAAETVTEETLKEEAVVEQTEEENSLEEATELSDEESDPVEKAKAKDTEDEDEDDKKVEAEEEGEEEDAKKKVESEDEDEKVEKQKMYSMDEYLEASKSALDGMAKLVKEIQSKAPDADHWEVFEIVYNAIYDIDEASWTTDNAIWNKIFDEVYEEVTSRTTKAKSLKVAETGSIEERFKALELLDPALAKVLMAEHEVNKAKALEAVQEREAVIRAKAREEGAEKYKRISSEECTTDQITDTMMELEVSNPDCYSVISKALDNASVITSAGELFRDLGSTDAANTLSADDYVVSKAKALAAQADEKGESYNMAALRASVRQSDEYVATYA